MYTTYYGLNEKPFSLNPDPAFLYRSKKHQTALSLLEYALLNHASFSVITGEIGTGKTTIIRYLLNRIDQTYTIGLINNTKYESSDELIRWILSSFGLEYENKEKVKLYQMFFDFLIKEYGRKHQVILIIDEAQNLSHAALEELRMISNINVDEHQVLQMILLGQDSLRDNLKHPDLKQFAQRISIYYHLSPLDRKDTHAYILHRLDIAGRGPRRKIFDLAACDKIYQYSGGTPRLINSLCDTALVYGFAEQKSVIDVEVIEEVIRDKNEGGLFSMPPVPVVLDESELEDLRALHDSLGGTEAKESKPRPSAVHPSWTEPTLDVEVPASRPARPAEAPVSGARPRTQPVASVPLPNVSAEAHESGARQIKHYRRLTYALGAVALAATLLLSYQLTRTLQEKDSLKPPPQQSTKNGVAPGEKPSLAVGRPEAGAGAAPPTERTESAAERRVESVQAEDAGRRPAQPVSGEEVGLTPRAAAPIPSGDAVAVLPREATPESDAVPSPASRVQSPGPPGLESVQVKPGDHLSWIIFQYYGRFDPEILEKVLEVNPQIANRHKLTVGTTVKLPRLSSQDARPAARGQ